VALTAAGIENARFEARLLLSKASGLATDALVAHARDDAPSHVIDALRALTARRVKREPMAYILGEREFWGLPFKVTPHVLVPRPDSETVVEAALKMLPDRGRDLRILDLGVGSGCLLLALLSAYPEASGVGLDVSREALAVARVNAQALGMASRSGFLAGDWRKAGWWRELGAVFDLVVCNPPYIETAVLDSLMPEVAHFEPRFALDGGPDGLAAYRHIATAATELVTRGGHLLAEVGAGQALEISQIFAAAGLSPGAPFKDLGGVDRVVPAKH